MTSILVCRGCCCGNPDRHPGIDHAGQLAAIRATAGTIGAKLFTVDCLGSCERANVVVVRTGVERRWFGGLRSAESVEAFVDWLEGGATRGEAVPSALAAHVFDTGVSGLQRRLLPITGPELAAWCATQLAERGSWSLGVPGAIAEFDVASERPEVRVVEAGDAASVEARTSTGAMRLRLDRFSRVFSFQNAAVDDARPVYVLARSTAGRGQGAPSADLASPWAARAERADATAHAGLRVLGPDVDAIDRVERDAILVDLGLGLTVARFLVRTRDDALLRELRRAEGTPFAELPGELLHALVVASPVRVVETALGRVEVTNPIPPPDGVTPPGSHTHLRPGALAVGLDLPPPLHIPPTWMVGAIVQAART